MIKDHPSYTPVEMRARAQAWFDRQIEIISKAHGSSWPDYRKWVEDYLREEIRQRLLELGWRPKK
jgi:hypothetical protein